MGLLCEGSPLTYEETRAWTSHVKKNGIEQFINVYKKFKDREGDPFKWGDEIEYLIIRFDTQNKRAQVSLRAEELLNALQSAMKENEGQPKKSREVRDCGSLGGLWRPEYAAYMIESSPGQPFGSSFGDLTRLASNMQLRRKEAQLFLPPSERILSMGNFPHLGCPGFIFPECFVKVNAAKSIGKSRYFPDEAAYTAHPKFLCITENVIGQRGSSIDIQIPIFADENTPKPFIDGEVERDGGGVSCGLNPGMICLDAVGFGCSCCALQITVQAYNMQQAKTLYDNLAPLAPIMLALTANTPFFRGLISDVDCRWDVLAGSIDCRNSEDMKVVSKPRVCSVNTYLSAENDRLNDIPLIYEEEHYQALIKGGVLDPILARHVAHLFVQDPVFLYWEKLHQNNEKDVEHFENIQSTNWQTMRFKHPPPDGSMGWRVEFRPCEVQLTDFENAAVATFIILLTRIIFDHKLRFSIPISKVDDNMLRASKRNAVLKEKFWFRNDPKRQETNGFACSLMTVNEIFNGSNQQGFVGLIPLIEKYLDEMCVDKDIRLSLGRYLDLLSGRARGDIYTGAGWMRDFITSHPKYKKDSVISEEMNYDLLRRIATLSESPCPKLFGKA